MVTRDNDVIRGACMGLWVMGCGTIRKDTQRVDPDDGDALCGTEQSRAWREGGGYKRNRDAVGGERGKSQTTGDLRKVLSKHHEDELVSCSQLLLCAEWRQRRGQRESEVLVTMELASTTLYLPTPVHPLRAHMRKLRPTQRGEGLGSLWPSHREVSSATELLGLGISTPPCPP